MIHEAIKGLLLPFLGTSLGAAGIYCVNGRTQKQLSSLLNDAAAGVMVAASIFSLLLPAFSQTDGCAAATLLVVLAIVWILIGAYYLKEQIKIRKQKNS